MQEYYAASAFDVATDMSGAPWLAAGRKDVSWGDDRCGDTFEERT